MSRVIRYFDKVDESYIDEVLLDVPLASLQELFGVDADNPMYDCYPIEKAQEAFFKTYSKINFNFDRFEYFLEYDA